MRYLKIFLTGTVFWSAGGFSAGPEDVVEKEGKTYRIHRMACFFTDGKVELEPWEKSACLVVEKLDKITKNQGFSLIFKLLPASKAGFMPHAIDAVSKFFKNQEMLDVTRCCSAVLADIFESAKEACEAEEPLLKFETLRDMVISGDSEFRVFASHMMAEFYTCPYLKELGELISNGIENKEPWATPENPFVECYKNIMNCKAQSNNYHPHANKMF